MEVQGVDWVNLIVISVAFEGEVFTLLSFIQMMYTNPSLYW
jgi:hypothetical protein